MSTPSDYGLHSSRAPEADLRYTRVRIGVAEFAFTSYESYVAALQQAWRAGFVPEPRGSGRGAEPGDAVPTLRSVDSDLGDLLQLRRRGGLNGSRPSTAVQ